MEDTSIVWTLFSAANFTYGPLLGLFMFGVLTKRRVNDMTSMLVSILVAIALYIFVTYILGLFSEYQFGSELLGINAGIVFFVLWIFSKKYDKTVSKDRVKTLKN